LSKDKKPTQKDNEESAPKIFRVVELRNTESATRRDFLSKTVKAVGAAGILSATSACDPVSVETFVEDGRCTCHVVCTCDAETDDEDFNWDSEYSGTICTCNKVCTCNSVCTCDSVSGGGGGHYWYPN